MSYKKIDCCFIAVEKCRFSDFCDMSIKMSYCATFLQYQIIGMLGLGNKLWVRNSSQIVETFQTQRRNISTYYKAEKAIFLFVCLGFMAQLEIFFLIRRRHHYPWRAANFDLCSALISLLVWRVLEHVYLFLLFLYLKINPNMKKKIIRKSLNILQYVSRYRNISRYDPDSRPYCLFVLLHVSVAPEIRKLMILFMLYRLLYMFLFLTFW